MALKEEICATTEGQQAYLHEALILKVSEMLCRIMQKQGVKRSELAARLGKNKGYVTKLLNGSAKTTLREISDAFFALGHQFTPDCSVLDSLPDNR